MRYFIYTILIAATLIGCSKDAAFTPSNDSGIGGSLARFTIVGDYLYIVDVESLNVYDIAQPENPTFLKDINLGFGIETIYPYNDKLFIGSEIGMYIYSITDPANPVAFSATSYEHVWSCDPVVVNDSIAFLTLRSGGDCQRGFVTNSLQVISIQDPANPDLIEEYPMENPFGLGIDGNTLFICDGTNGLRIYDISNPYQLEQIQHIQGIETYDVIPLNGLLMVVGPTQIYQYDYSDIDNIVKVSEIPIAS